MSGHARQDIATAFTAMASPCVVLVDTPDGDLGRLLGSIAREEAQRIEAKYSRYRPSVVTRINESAGCPFEVDAETADLIDYAVSCYELSSHRFDITSGALRRAWTFDRCAQLPTAAKVEEALAFVGWQRVSWSRPLLRLAPGMEIDFGGIGKEYAVDRALALVQAESPAPTLVNFGGDLCVSGPRQDGTGWRVAIEDVQCAGTSAGLLEFTSGALATSGDTHRHVMSNGVRYGHVLNPTTGWPIQGAPRSVTVHAPTCSEAGLLAKLALLSGPHAEEFLRAEQVRAWCAR